MRVLVIAHVFYPELWTELRSCIEVIGDPKDVVVTYVDEEAVGVTRRDLPMARYVKCENRGFDVWPFLKALQETDFAAYDLVIKLHTKRNVDFGFDFRIRRCRMSGSAWRDLLLSFCRSRSAWLRTRLAFKDASVGMVAERHLIVRREDVPYGHAEAAFDEAVRELSAYEGVGATTDLHYVAGTMFAVRPSVLKFLLRKKFTVEMFPESAHVTNTDRQYAHALERLLGFAVSACGLRIAGWNESRVWRWADYLGLVLKAARSLRQRYCRALVAPSFA